MAAAVSLKEVWEFTVTYNACTVCSAVHLKYINSENKALLLTDRWGGIFQKWGGRAPSNKSRGSTLPASPRFRRHMVAVIDGLQQVVTLSES